MKTLQLLNYAQDGWYQASGGLADVQSAITGDVIATTGSQGLDFKAMLDHARDVGGPALRHMTFHERAWMLKDLANAIMARKEELYELNYQTGATRTDGWIDIEGGAGTLFSFSSKGRRELPNQRILIDGQMEPLSKGGTFVGQHVWTSLQGVAVHINAFNFPVWGMLEKLAPTLLAGVPAIVKPASATGYLAEHCVRIMIEANILPKGALQLIMGGVGDLLDHLTLQDVVSFTGSAQTAMKLQTHRVFARESVRRAIAPKQHIDAVQEALSARLAKQVIGDPRQEGVTMGALASRSQVDSVRQAVGELSKHARIVSGDPDSSPVTGNGCFMSPILLRSDDPWGAAAIHDVEAFGPVSTLMPYEDMTDAVALANRGLGSLVLSLFTNDPVAAETFVLGAGAYHGRMMIVDRTSAKESTGHGSPLPVLVHGGPGRAGGGEEMGGVRGVTHYMQRTALQGSPTLLSSIVKQWLPGAAKPEGDVHPFRKRISELEVGYTLKTASRTVTLEDIEHFAHFTGDTFYAHMDDEAAKASPIFEGRVAHGYLILSFAAGLFVEPAPGPVLANTGLENLRFLTPLYPGDSMRVELTVKTKSVRDEEKGEVRWAVYIFNQKDEIVATYDLLTMNTP
jgi:oxepin-CoA hydrolase/3-oxo-5,6-dehydrosuberyl-CoA semialdehyde dehydrogenase